MQANQKLVFEALWDAVKAELIRVQYKKPRIQLYEKIWEELRFYMQELNIGHFDMEVGLKFLQEVHGITNLHYLSGAAAIQVRAINMLAEYQIHGYVLSKIKTKPHDFTQIARKLFDAYLTKRTADGKCAKTLESDRIYLNRFSDYIESIHLKSLADLEANHVFGYVNSMAGLTKSSVYCGLCNLRGVMRYLYGQGVIQVDLSHVVPHIKLDKTAKIPSAFSPAEVKLLLNSVDRGNPKGKRDYAILLLAAMLGMRAGEICNLTFSNINWVSNEIAFNQTKTGKRIVLPLMTEVGNAIIEYLKYGRPISNYEHVFIRHVCPITQLSEPTLHSIVSIYFKRAGIAIPPGKKHGPHALRHSLASALLEKNIPLPVISEILGHEDSDTTSIYLKIDLTHLRQCALDVLEQAKEGGSNAAE